MKIAVITCYFDPDYVRSLSLRAGFAALPGTEVIVVKNSHHGLLRYLEITWKLLKLRFGVKPEVYVLSFRGQEILPLVLLIAGRQPVVFDEFVVPLAWANLEQHHPTFKIRLQKALTRLFTFAYKRWLKRCRIILSDTEPDARISSELSGVNRDVYVVVPIGAEESMFLPDPSFRKTTTHADNFELFFCGNMRPLYGLEYVLEALKVLTDIPGIHLTVAGGKADIRKQVEAARATGLPVDYEAWVPFDELPERMRQADLCLAGPYGDTAQASRVITGKTYQMLACAAPSLIGRSDATGDFTDKKNCLLVERGNVQALEEAIRWAHQHRHLLPEVGIAGRRLYEERFSISAISAKLGDALTRLA